MKKIAIYPILLLFLFAACKNEKELKNEPKAMTVGSLTLSTEQPKPGESIDIAYKSAEEVKGFYTYLVGSKSYPVDIDFTTNDGEQKSSIKIPDSAIALAFIIKKDDTYDNNEKQGYLIPLYNEEGQKISGSNAAMAFYAQNNGADYGFKKEESEVMAAMKSDLAAHPELQESWQLPYLRSLYKQNKEEGKKEIDAYLETLSKKADKTEKDYQTMMNLYGMTKNREKSDSIRALAVQKYPKGQAANYEMINAFQAEPDLEKRVQIFENFKQKNPKLGNLGNYMANKTAMDYFEQKDMANFEKFSKMVEDKGSRASTLNNMAWGMAEEGKNLEEAEKMSKSSLELVEDMQKNVEDKPDYLTKRQYEKNLKSTYNMYADTYGLILFKQGKIKDAINYQEKAVDDGSSVDVNERYIEFLMADQQYETAAKKAENFIEKGQGSEKIQKDYKTAYMKVNPDSKDFDAKLKELNEKAAQNAMAEIKKSMLDEEAPQFNLKDMKGDMVSLESLKGKTVILDFWATWCGPCKASFPGMQEVVTKYKDDDSVKLLFVDTFEAGDDREKKVEDFIKKNKYSFHVVYDSDDSTMAGKYGVTGIPTKVVIGPDGRIKFKSVGYNGSNTKLVNEMDMMIAALKP